METFPDSFVADKIFDSINSNRKQKLEQDLKFLRKKYMMLSKEKQIIMLKLFILFQKN
jgi:hypothetical protein